MSEVERENTALLVWESSMARMEREHERERKTLKTIIIALFVLLLISVGGLIGMFVYESQFVDEQIVAEADAEDGGNAIANIDGEVLYNGEIESNDP